MNTDLLPYAGVMNSGLKWRRTILRVQRKTNVRLLEDEQT